MTTGSRAVEALTACYSSVAEAYQPRWASALHPAAAQLLDRLPLAPALRVTPAGRSAHRTARAHGHPGQGANFARRLRLRRGLGRRLVLVSPTRADFITRHAALGTTGRRLAALDPATQSAFLSVQSRLEELAPEDFFAEREVIAATAIAP